MHSAQPVDSYRFPQGFARGWRLSARRIVTRAIDRAEGRRRMLSAFDADPELAPTGATPDRAGATYRKWGCRRRADDGATAKSSRSAKPAHRWFVGAGRGARLAIARRAHRVPAFLRYRRCIPNKQTRVHEIVARGKDRNANHATAGNRFGATAARFVPKPLRASIRANRADGRLLANDSRAGSAP